MERHNAEEARFFADHLGETRYDWLIERMQQTFRYKPWERSEMTAHYREQMRSIEAKRLKGDTGEIHVSAWD